MHRFTGDISIVLGGAAGQGIQTVETLLVQVLKKEGYHVFASKEYMSRIRGGSNSTEIRLTSKKRRAYVDRIDLLFALDKNVVPHLAHRITEKTVIIGEKEKVCETECQVVDVPFTRFANELGHPIYTSTVAVGVVLGMLRADESVFHEYLRGHFARKGEEVVAKNIEAAKKGYLHGTHISFVEGVELSVPRADNPDDGLLLDGMESVGLGTLAAGCNYISSYPMSPGTGLLTFLAAHNKDFGIVVDQAEDEIAAINQGLGAWYAGARAVVTTSGGGFALMCEGVSLAGMIETPIVIHVGQRPGPATGLPTRTEQADLNLVLYAGHGEFPRVIFAPGTPEEAYHAMSQAFYIADKYQVPAFVLTDQFFLDSVTTVDDGDLKAAPNQAYIVETDAEYERYAVTKDGVSPRGIPGYGKGLVGVDSDEHDTAGHITESHLVRLEQQGKRLRKGVALAKEALPPVASAAKLKKAKTVIVTWGSNHGVVEEALDKLDDPTLAQIHFPQVYPLPAAGKKLLTKIKHIVVIENNAAGQFADLLEREYSITVTERILKYDGNPFSVEELVKRLSKL
ncbi:MAG: 2-oxoacid:acceptor oxidoreductase subunit alpha [Candidatus Moraniibacteriota bacterium]